MTLFLITNYWKRFKYWSCLQFSQREQKVKTTIFIALYFPFPPWHDMHWEIFVCLFSIRESIVITFSDKLVFLTEVPQYWMVLWDVKMEYGNILKKVHSLTSAIYVCVYICIHIYIYTHTLLNNPVSASQKYQVTQSNSKPTNPKYQIRFKAHYWHWAWAANLDPVLSFLKVHRNGQKEHLNSETRLDPILIHPTESKKELRAWETKQ